MLALPRLAQGLQKGADLGCDMGFSEGFALAIQALHARGHSSRCDSLASPLLLLRVLLRLPADILRCWLCCAIFSAFSRACRTAEKTIKAALAFEHHIGNAEYEDLLPSVQAVRARHRALLAQIGLPPMALRAHPTIPATEIATSSTSDAQHSTASGATSTNHGAICDSDGHPGASISGSNETSASSVESRRSGIGLDPSAPGAVAAVSTLGPDTLRAIKSGALSF